MNRLLPLLLLLCLNPAWAMDLSSPLHPFNLASPVNPLSPFWIGHDRSTTCRPTEKAVASAKWQLENRSIPCVDQLLKESRERTPTESITIQRNKILDCFARADIEAQAVNIFDVAENCQKRAAELGLAGLHTLRVESLRIAQPVENPNGILHLSLSICTTGRCIPISRGPPASAPDVLTGKKSMTIGSVMVARLGCESLRANPTEALATLKIELKSAPIGGMTKTVAVFEQALTTTRPLDRTLTSGGHVLELSFQ